MTSLQKDLGPLELAAFSLKVALAAAIAAEGAGRELGMGSERLQALGRARYA